MILCFFFFCINLIFKCFRPSQNELYLKNITQGSTKSFLNNEILFLNKKKTPKSSHRNRVWTPTPALKTQQRGESLLLNITLHNPLENLLLRQLFALGGINATDKNWSNKCTPWVCLVRNVHTGQKQRNLLRSSKETHLRGGGDWLGTTKTRAGVGNYFVPLYQRDEGHPLTWFRKKRLIMIKWGFMKSFQHRG